jgi:hypothetical protein
MIMAGKSEQPVYAVRHDVPSAVVPLTAARCVGTPVQPSPAQFRCHENDLRTGFAALTGETAASAHADITEAGRGWHRAWISATFSGTDLRAVLQLAGAQCSTRFDPSGESLLLRDIRLERGQVPLRLKGSLAQQEIRASGSFKIKQERRSA